MIINKSAFFLGMGLLLTGAPAIAHGHHHGKPLTDKERRASEGFFEDIDVKARTLSDWDGVWQSVNPYLLRGDLDLVLAHKAKQGNKTLEEYRAYYKKGYATDIETIGIENGVIEFTSGKEVNSCRYDYAGYKILTYSSGKKGVRYLFECNDSKSKTPKFVQFSDHTVAPRQSQHFHLFMGNVSQEALLQEMDNWPTYYPYNMTTAQVVDEMLHH